MNTQLAKIQQTIEPLRQEIINHKLYSAINDLEDLKTFMNYHVYAVWDFMSLLKSLQNQLTCTSIPWFPMGSAETRYLINEIVLGEESDVDLFGERKSHFEMYLEAMQQSEADTTQIETFINGLRKTGDLASSFTIAQTPHEAQDFVNFTFDSIETGKSHAQAAIFTFGREDLIPSMFHSIVNDLHRQAPEKISKFKYYLERHIEVDGDHHSHLALQMTSNLCGTDAKRWEEAEQATIDCLQKRITLWNGAYEAIRNKTLVTTD